jgi:hypothetical protein
MRASAKLPIGISGRDGTSVLWTTSYHICEVNMACLVRMALLMLGFVNAKTEEFLNLFLWSAEQLMRPTFRNLTDSYEAWPTAMGCSSKYIGWNESIGSRGVGVRRVIGSID